MKKEVIEKTLSLLKLIQGLTKEKKKNKIGLAVIF